MPVESVNLAPVQEFVNGVPAAVALAILTVGDRYVLQHRDDDPGVASPGCWALFGGGLHDGETTGEAIRPEINDELSLDVSGWRELWRVRCFVPFWGASVPHAIFDADVTSLWPRHVLHEGQGTGVFSIAALPQPMEAMVVALLERYQEQIRGRRG
jgi:8-oxo-dGTP pyrophosphatase MutT (NUDIX family)